VAAKFWIRGSRSSSRAANKGGECRSSAGLLLAANARMKRLLLIPTLLLCAVGCSSSDRNGDASEDNLMNGREATAGDFPSTVELVGLLACTGTKVGPSQILTAAHCVSDSRGGVGYYVAPGRKIQVVLRGGGNSPTSFTVKKVHLHPRTTKTCTATQCDSSSYVFDAVPDIAVIETNEEIPNTPNAKVDVVVLEASSAVTMNGYGCTSLGGTNPGELLRYASARTSAMNDLAHYDFNATDITKMAGNYSLAVAQSHSPALCSGDSGGPLYRRGGSIVVGINSTSIPRTDTTPTFDWFTRVDGKARFGIAAWLESLGVELTAACTASSCIPVSDE
jgi:hypothetical protein